VLRQIEFLFKRTLPLGTISLLLAFAFCFEKSNFFFWLGLLQYFEIFYLFQVIHCVQNILNLNPYQYK
jgi:hypothetical protein